MALSIGKILMAYRPLYLRGLLMDGQYRFPVTTPETATGKKEEVSKQVAAERVSLAPRRLRGARA
jgi:hypothetical protein